VNEIVGRLRELLGSGAALAQSGEQQKRFWRLQEDQTEAQKKGRLQFQA
jgi:hypothetical protein